MATTTAEQVAPRLTPKQQTVLDQMRDGKEVAAIAKRMGISTSGVYGHIRQIRKLGIDVVGQAVEARTNGATEDGGTEPEAANNGHPADDVVEGTLEHVVKTIETCHKRVAHRKDQAERLRQEIEAIEEQQELDLARLEKLTAARDALV